MSKSEQIKSQMRKIIEDHPTRVEAARLDVVIEAIFDEFESETDMESSEIEQKISGFNLVVREPDSKPVSYKMDLGHGPVPIPHRCHKKIELCVPLPNPDNPEEFVLACVEIEIPWPCPDEADEVL